MGLTAFFDKAETGTGIIFIGYLLTACPGLFLYVAAEESDVA